MAEIDRVIKKQGSLITYTLHVTRKILIYRYR